MIRGHQAGCDETCCAEVAATVSRRKRRRQRPNDPERRAARAQALVMLGELSSARQAVEGEELAPGTEETLRLLRDPLRRPPRPREVLPAHLREIRHGSLFKLDEDSFTKNIRSAKRGVAPGPSGMTFDHLRPILDSPRDTHVLFLVAEIMARAQIPADIIGAVRVGRMTAFRKRTGGVRGIVAGDALRLLIARTIAQQMGEAVKAATAPLQYALSTRAGCECVAHALQAMSDLNPNATITSIDGVSAYDSISRRAMLEELEKVLGGREVLPFVLMFYGSPSSYLWEDEGGETHSIAQGEGGEQGDPLMPLLFASGQHPALLATQRRLGPVRKSLRFSGRHLHQD